MGRISTVDLLVLTSLDQLVFIMKILFTFVTKQVVFMRRSIVLSPLQLAVPAYREQKVVRLNLVLLSCQLNPENET
jgi:hypothetical protein